MLGSAAVAQVQQILGWRSDKETEILAALQFAQTEREKPGMTFPWWLWREDESLAVVAATQEVALPTGYIQDSEEKDGNLRYRASATTRSFFLKKMDYQEAENFYFGSWTDSTDQDATMIDSLSPGSPKSYVLRQSSLRIYPIPDQAYTLTWSYWGADDAITLISENRWLLNAPWVLIGDAAVKLGSDLGNAQAVATAQGILTRAESNMFRATIHRREAGRKRAMGSRL